MIQASSIFRRRRHAFAVPGIQTDVMMITAGGNKSRLITIFHHQLKTQQAAIKIERALQVGNFEMHMTNACLRGNGIIHTCKYITLPEQACKKKPHRHGYRYANETGQHKTVIKQIFTDVRAARPVKLDSREQGRITG